METIEEINDEWDNDRIIGNLQSEILYIPSLHHKYYKVYLTQKAIFNQLEAELATLEKDKFQSYKDGPSKEDKKKKWVEQINTKGAIKNKSELDILMKGDADILATRKKVKDQEMKIELLIDILKMINNRSFYIQTAIDIRKFEAAINP